MVFFQWLQDELHKLGWSQTDLVNSSTLAGYPISQAQLSRIITGARQAGPDACIAIAHALELSREEVFRARGWLFRELLEPMAIDPRAERLIRTLSEMPFESREITLDVIESVVESARKFTEKMQEQAANRQENEK
jgi:hypothetical protein